MAEVSEPSQKKDVKKDSKTTAQKGESRPIEPEVIAPLDGPLDIVISTFKSLDAQIDEINKIPTKVQNESDVLITILYDDKRDILQTEVDGRAFMEAALKVVSEIGHAWHALLMMEREEVRPEKETLQLPPMPVAASNQPQLTGPVIMGQPAVVKRGWFADFWEHRSSNRWAKAYEHAIDANRKEPEITGSKVKNVKDYGLELEAEWQKLFDFITRAQCLVRHRKDENTIRNIMREIRLQTVKLTQITKAFTTTIVEYRKDKFGDRKVWVAAGAMAIANASAEPPGMTEPPGDELAVLLKENLKRSRSGGPP